MIGITNVSGGGGGRCVGIIRVLYPAATVCTCTNGTMTFRADQSGDYWFTIPSAGNWTVSGVDTKGVSKTISVAITKGIAKTITFDTLIPPAYRNAYREVEYLEFGDTPILGGYEKLNIPLDTNMTPGSWDLEFENLWLKNANHTQYIYTAIYNDSSLRLRELYTGHLVIDINNSGRVASEIISTQNNLNYKIHWSSVAETDEEDQTIMPTSLTVSGMIDGSYYSKVLITNATAPTLFYNYPLYVGMHPDASGYTWPGRYGSLKLTQNKVLIRHFIPCKRILDNDNSPGYYDLVNNIFMRAQKNNDATSSLDGLITCGPEIGA